MIHHGDCLKVMKTFEANSIDSIVTDPPYGLEFMGKEWDHGIPGVPFWAEMLRVAKPGAMLLAFGGTRTHHRLMVAIEDAGWKIRDCLMWLYGSGFPKSMDISKAIDKSVGAARKVIGKKRHPTLRKGRLTKGRGAFHADDLDPEWDITEPATDDAKKWNGWGTALKPAWEPIVLAMKPLEGTYVANALEHGVAGLNIDGCRISFAEGENNPSAERESESLGRWPANVILDEVAGELLDQQTDASRFYYCAKARKKEKGSDNKHPTVKPLALMEYLVRLTMTPTVGVVLDPFAGSGTTLVACKNVGRPFIGIEQSEEYIPIIKKRLAA